MNFEIQLLFIFCLTTINIRQINTSDMDLKNTLLDIFGEPPDEKSINSTIPAISNVKSIGLNKMILNHFGPPIKLMKANQNFNKEKCKMTSSGWDCQDGVKPNDAESKSSTNPGKETFDPAVEDQIRKLFHPMRSPPLIKEHDFVRKDADLGYGIFTKGLIGMDYKFQSQDKISERHLLFGNQEDETTIQPHMPEKTTMKLFEPPAFPNHVLITSKKDNTKVLQHTEIGVNTEVEPKPIEIEVYTKYEPRPIEIEAHAKKGPEPVITGVDTMTKPGPSRVEEDTKIAPTASASKTWDVTEQTHSPTEKSEFPNITDKLRLNSTQETPNKSSCKSVNSFCLHVLLLLSAIVLC